MKKTSKLLLSIFGVVAAVNAQANVWSWFGNSAGDDGNANTQGNGGYSQKTTSSQVKTQPQQTINYQIILDAGSSGTRVYVYQETSDSAANKFPQIKELFQEKLSNPLASHVNDQAGTEALITSLLNKASAHIPATVNHSTIKVNVLATAGMRKLSAADQAQIYSYVKPTITKLGYSIGDVRTMEGYQEGIYTWAALNYLDDGFARVQPLGSYEVGGASMQIVYPTSKTLPTGADSKDYWNVKLLNGKEVYVFSRTWLGLGDNDSFKAMNQASNPDRMYCFPIGYSESATNSAGKFDMNLCKQEYSKVIGNQLAMVHPAGVTFNGVSSPAYMLKVWGIEGKPSQLRTTANTYCAQNLTAVDTQIQDKKANINEVCAKSAYNDEMLDLLGQNTNPQYQARLKVGADNSEVNWTLGYYVVANNGITK